MHGLRTGATAAVALASLLLVGAAPWEVPQQLVKLPDGRRINLYCTGKGSPTIILEAGFHATMWSYGKLQPRIAQTNRVCSYDRAAMGFSDPGPLPRDGRAIVADLTATLAAAKVAPPWVLVGHSAGGMSIRLFADAHPRDVVGMVFLDPSVENGFEGRGDFAPKRVANLRRCADAAEAKALPSTDPALAACNPVARPSFSPAMQDNIDRAALDPVRIRSEASEYESLAGATDTQVRAGRQSYGDMPIVVLSAGLGGKSDPARVAQHRALAARSTRGVHRTVAEGEHNLMGSSAEDVLKAIAEVARPRG